MAILDVGLFTGFEPVAEDLEQVRGLIPRLRFVSRFPLLTCMVYFRNDTLVRTVHLIPVVAFY